MNGSRTPQSQMQRSEADWELALPQEGPLALVGLLFQEAAFWNKGLRVELFDSEKVALHLKGHYRGCWHCKSGAYHWIPAAYAQPDTSVSSAVAAVAHTIDRLLDGPRTG